MSALLLVGAIVSEVIATISLRASDGLRKKWWAFPIFAFYAAAFGMLALALSAGMPVGIAYGIWAACGVALTAVAARVFFKDPLTTRMSLGIGLIAIGVLIIQLGANTH
ncbi:DMT family transporter [Cellulosimicrobium cellulans]|uniref:DMT family transporter n=1 Tax=Cellulosimicrobium cellulans TaxID=1710 RepID=UPI0036E4B501